MKQADRTRTRPGLPKSNPIPYGSGSVQVRGRVWWMIYRDPEGRVVQESTRSDDQQIARRMLAERAIVTLEARIAALRAVIDEAQENRDADKRAQSDDDVRGRRPRVSAIPAHPASGRASSRTEQKKGGRR